MRRAEQPSGDDVASLSERIGYLLGIRAFLVLTALAVGLAAPSISGGLSRHLLNAVLLYVGCEAGLELFRRRGSRRRLRLLNLGLLIDGVFIVWLVHLTGGARSPFQFLIAVHLIATMLLASYRTGLKIAVWDSLLFIVVVRASQVGAVPDLPWLPPQPVDAATFRLVAIDLAAIWTIALVTAVLSAVNERVLRRQRADLASLARVVAAIDACTDAVEVPPVLLDGMGEHLGFERGAVIASPDGALRVLATRGAVAPGIEELAPVGVVDRAFGRREVQAVARLDPDRDAELAGLIPEARNVLIAPLFLDGGFRLGVLVLEAPAGRPRIRRWDVALLEQASAHAALALHKAWLRHENEERTAEIRRLRDELLGQNLQLESAVIERTHELDGRLAELRQAHDDRRRLLSHLVRAQDDERRRIAGDIHDDPVQRLAALNMHLQLARDASGEPQIRAELAQLSRDLREVMRGLRSLTFELHPSILDEVGLAAALDAYAERFEMKGLVTIDDRLADEPPIGSRMVLYRVAQEALANVRKHANASHASITIEERDETYVIRVIDDGAGFAPSTLTRSRPGHLGLSSMRERAEMVGGGCVVHSLPGGGTTVECWVPAIDVDPTEEAPPTDGSAGAPAFVPERLLAAAHAPVAVDDQA